jgi:cysteine-rich repeat protein
VPLDGFTAYRDTISQTAEQIAQCSSELATGDIATGCQPLCGNGKIDAGETCDDGNQVEGDSCPSNCVVASCTDGGDVTATVNFAAPAGVDLTAIQVLVGYPEDKIRIPGSANQAQVLNRIFVTDPVAALSANDLNYAVRLLVNTDGSTAITGGPSLLTVDFDTCIGAPAVTDGDFACVVQATSAFGPVADAVFATTCSVDVP